MGEKFSQFISSCLKPFQMFAEVIARFLCLEEVFPIWTIIDARTGGCVPHFPCDRCTSRPQV